MYLALLMNIDEPNDREYMVWLYNEFVRLMFYTAHKYISDNSICEDVVQESLLKLIAKVSLLREKERCVLVAYIVSTVKNTCFNYLKKQNAEKERLNDYCEATLTEGNLPEQSLDELLLAKENRNNLSKVWDLIPEEDRILLEGKYILGYSNETLAQYFDCKPDSVRMKLTRARRKAIHLFNNSNEENSYDAT